MSGPVDREVPTTPEDAAEAEQVCELDVLSGRRASVGRFEVARLLPRRSRRTVGPWCFVDHFGPADVAGDAGMGVGPHPHIGLQTVTWLLDGEARHRDSLGSDQVLRPGQLNLMTAGRGVAHAEEGTGTYRGPLEGIQLWVAQPDATRTGPPAFEHHTTLPVIELDGGVATVLVGELGPPGDDMSSVIPNRERSPARHDSPQVGIDLDLQTGSTSLPLDPAFEHAVVVVRGQCRVRCSTGTSATLGPDDLTVVDPGHHELTVDSDGPARVLVLGGAPFGAELVMWWNYVARTRDEITEAHRAWTAGDARFGSVDSVLERVDVDPPAWSRP